MKTIVVATDYSHAASNALAYAAALALPLKARLVLFNSFQLPPPMAVSVLPQDDRESYSAQNRFHLQELAQQTAQQYGLEVNWDTKLALLPDALDDEVRQSGANLVVMGMREHSDDAPLMDNSATSTIRQARYPVLIVPEKAVFTAPKRILFACDYATLKAEDSLEMLQELAQTFQARVQVLHVGKEEDVPATAAATASHPCAVKVEEALGKLRHEYKYLEDEDVVHGINQGVEEFKADLLVMVPHKATFWNALLHTSKTSKLAIHTHVPLLALPHARH